MIEALNVGILGGGQLGKMLIQAALDLDLNIHVLDPDPNCSCAHLVENFTCGSITDYDTVIAFGQNLDLITIEIENVNVEALAELEKNGKKVYPQPHIINNIKNKVSQKIFYSENNIPSAAFELVENRKEILDKAESLPFVNKLAVGGYDGKGVQVISKREDLEKGFDAPGLIEDLIDFEKELAIIVARSVSGEIKTFPLVEMAFHAEANLVDYLFSPAHVSPLIAEKAEKLAILVAEKYEIIGLLAVEMFLDKNENLLVNEVAPRPHNSGHHTLRANHSSQFDQHWRAILGLPLANTNSILPSAMVNILGEEGHTGPVKIEGLDKVLAQDNVYPYFYGKKITKPFRKMGHVSILAKDFESLKEKVIFVQENLKIKSIS